MVFDKQIQQMNSQSAEINRLRADLVQERSANGYHAGVRWGLSHALDMLEAVSGYTGTDASTIATVRGAVTNAGHKYFLDPDWRKEVPSED